MESISVSRVARTVSWELTYLAPKSKWISSMVKTAGFLSFSWVKMPRINYSAPPTTLDSIYTEEIPFQNIFWFSLQKSLLISLRRADFPAPEKPLIRIPLIGPSPFYMRLSLWKREFSMLCFKSLISSEYPKKQLCYLSILEIVL